MKLMRGMRRRQFILWLSGVVIVVAASVYFACRARQASLEATFDRALQALQRNELAPVLAAINRLDGCPEYEPQVHLLRGALHTKAGEYQSALSEFSRFDPQGKLRDPTLLLTGKCLYRLGRLPEGEFVLRQLATHDPGNIDAHRILAAIYCEIGAHSPSAEELERVIELAPDDYTPHRLLAMMHMQYEEYTQATDRFRRALALSPRPEAREDIISNLGYCLLALRDYQAAIDVLEEATPNAVNLARRAECHWSLGEQETADQLLQQARAIDPHERAVLSLQARVQMDTGHPQDAAMALQQLLSRRPYDTAARYQLALAYQQLGDEVRSQAEMARWQELLELDQRLTTLSDEAGRDPYNVELRDKLADVCTALGRIELAEIWRRAAATLRAGRGTPVSAWGASATAPPR